MKTDYDCVPCFIRQALDAARLATSDEKIHEQVLRGVLVSMSRMDLRKSPPLMGQYIHRMIRTLSGIDDPYKEVKNRFNRFALELYPVLKERIVHSSHPLETAVRLSIAGNIIDFGAKSAVKPGEVHETIDRALADPLFGNIESFLDTIFSAKTILYIGDNAGEIVFDRLLIEQLPVDRITFAVRGDPVINDATMEDAEDTGMKEVVEVIDNGSDAPGTILDECSEGFRRCFFGADLIIAKGQGNYETLSDVDKPIGFILKSKCPVIARHIGCPAGSLVIRGKNLRRRRRGSSKI
jgi:uncharacterized protein with ATP-grasp and redox domains